MSHFLVSAVWPDSQNFLSLIRKLFVTFGYNILRFLNTKSVFLKPKLLEIDVIKK